MWGSNPLLFTEKLRVVSSLLIVGHHMGGWDLWRDCLLTSLIHFSVFLKKLFVYLCIYLFLAALALHCCAWAFSSCGERGLLFVVVCGLLIVVTSFVAEHGL